MKKLTALFLTFLLLLTVCACGSSGSEGEGKDPSGEKSPMLL